MIRGVVRHKRVHEDLVCRDSKSIREALWQELEDLTGGLRLADHEFVIQTIVEAKLDQGRIRWRRRHTSLRLDKLRNVCWNAGDD